MATLYNKYRPMSWDAVIGQEGVVETLKNSVVDNKIASAYIFQGPRGTGKTTCARIFAKALNCETPIEPGVPCGKCPTCTTIAQDESPNVIEIDAATNTGVDNMRDIKMSANTVAAGGGWKFFIIDECHMLSKAAQNSALKLFEEPPPKTVFVLCTTELNKVEGTIISRALRFDFRPVNLDGIIGRLRYICQQEGFESEDAALKMVAKAANGGMRDSISILERVALENMNKVKVGTVVRSLGITPTEIMIKLGQVIQGDYKVGFDIVEGVINNGYDIYQFFQGSVDYFRDMLLLKLGVPSVVLADAETMDSLQKTAHVVSVGVIREAIAILEEAMTKYRYAENKRILIEMALYKIAGKKDVAPQVTNVVNQMPAQQPIVQNIVQQVEPGLVEQMVRAALNGIDFTRYLPQQQAPIPADYIRPIGMTPQVQQQPMPQPVQMQYPQQMQQYQQQPMAVNTPMVGNQSYGVPAQPVRQRPMINSITQDQWQAFLERVQVHNEEAYSMILVSKKGAIQNNTQFIHYDKSYGGFYDDVFNERFAHVCSKVLSDYLGADMYVKAMPDTSHDDTISSHTGGNSPNGKSFSGQVSQAPQPAVQQQEYVPSNLGRIMEEQMQNGSAQNAMGNFAQPIQTQSFSQAPVQPVAAPVQQFVPQQQPMQQPTYQQHQQSYPQQQQMPTSYQQPQQTPIVSQQVPFEMYEAAPVSDDTPVSENMLFEKFGFGGQQFGEV